MKIKKEILSLIIIVIISSCNIDDFSSQQEFNISGINGTSFYYGDTLTFFYSGVKPDEYQIELQNDIDTNDISSEILDQNKGRFNFVNVNYDGVYKLIFSYLESSIEYEVTLYSIPYIETVEITSGTFIQGNDKGFLEEKPTNIISLTKDLVVSKYEITNGIWKLINNDLSLSNDLTDLPVNNVEWLEAVDFCNSLSDIYQLERSYSIDNGDVIFDHDANGWRLPTEAEWEYIAKSGKNVEFSGSLNHENICWYNGNSGYNPQVVGNKLPNEWGLYDMNGNLLEWCWDYYTDYTTSSSITSDPRGPDTGQRRVRRGGAYNYPLARCRTSSRNFTETSLENTGFRIVRNN